MATPKVPLTQESKALKALIEFVTGKPCEKMPTTFSLANGSQLTKSSKGDVYYMTTLTACSCPGFTYHRNCKHVKSLQSRNTVEASRTQAKAYQARQKELREKGKAVSEALDSIRPTGKWAGGHNGPVLEMA
jgi:hypothetical protein